ncbi:hypothetical protein ACQKPX_16885 [Photobacterium sp. DNB23_23_1]
MSRPAIDLEVRCVFRMRPMIPRGAYVSIGAITAITLQPCVALGLKHVSRF